MSKFVNFEGRLVPAVIFEPLLKTRYDCTFCSDTGVTRERIDDERCDVMVPCWMCRPYCPACKQSRKKGHVCQGKGIDE
jgi:hypothetical protein